jgi:hypothetical protein
VDNELGTSIGADKNLAALGDGWTKSLKNIPEFSYQKLKEYLVLDAKKTPDNKPAEAFKHQKVDTDFSRPVIQGNLWSSQCEERR